jgi:hypothetical protein
MFKSSMAGISMMLLTLASVCAHAVVERAIFEVRVTIPTADFYVLPTDPDWIGREQKLNWDLTAQELSPLRKHFDVKNSNGGITARLNEEAYLSNGRAVDNIALDVQFNRIKLRVNDASVISEIDGKTGKRVELVISAVKPNDGYKPGEYYGSVHMIFEAVVP